MNYKYENLDRLIYILIGALLAVVFELASRARINVSGDGIWHGLNYNLLVYALALIGAFVLFCVLAWLVERLRRKKEGASPAAAGRAAVRMQRAVLYGFYTIAAAALIALICRIYVNECNLPTGSIWLPSPPSPALSSSRSPASEEIPSGTGRSGSQPR